MSETETEMGMICKIKNWYYSQNTQQSVNVITSFFSDSFSVVMASLLSVFVPQNCEDHICTLTENFSNLISFNVFTLAFNFLTLFFFLLLYIIELKREKYMINHFEYNSNMPEKHLLSYENEYPNIFQTFFKLNKHYYLSYKYLFFVYNLNFLFSSILVLYYYYYDYRSVTVLLTNVLLCYKKIKKGYDVSEKSLKSKLAYSYFNVVHLSFNDMEPKLNTLKETYV